uniref:Dynastin-5 n=1 Tax=Limnodynastes salmini TaxID=39404 RepID=DYS5_LIMSA|nr:RecName: Full=Dynastin-5 [Limnodynastes salmini]prf//1923189B dynastin 5 [Limnodynastes salmini]
GLISNLGI